MKFGPQMSSKYSQKSLKALSPTMSWPSSRSQKVGATNLSDRRGGFHDNKQVRDAVATGNE